jgi:hypothetical protein
MIFVDESAVKVSAGRFFVVGAVKVRKPGQLLRSVQDTPQWVAHARVTAKLLVGIINRRELAAALLDQVTTPRGYAFDDTVRDMVKVRPRQVEVPFLQWVTQTLRSELRAHNLGNDHKRSEAPHVSHMGRFRFAAGTSRPAHARQLRLRPVWNNEGSSG